MTSMRTKENVHIASISTGFEYGVMGRMLIMLMILTTKIIVMKYKVIIYKYRF